MLNLQIVRNCPSVAELTQGIGEPARCKVQGCGRLFTKPPALRLHLVKTHKIIQV